jgi:hypothetical protein
LDFCKYYYIIFFKLYLIFYSYNFLNFSNLIFIIILFLIVFIFINILHIFFVIIGIILSRSFKVFFLKWVLVIFINIWFIRNYIGSYFANIEKNINGIGNKIGIPGLPKIRLNSAVTLTAGRYLKTIESRWYLSIYKFT